MVTLQKLTGSNLIFAVVDHDNLPLPTAEQTAKGCTLVVTSQSYGEAAKACGKYHDEKTGKLYTDAAMTKAASVNDCATLGKVTSNAD